MVQLTNPIEPEVSYASGFERATKALQSFYSLKPQLEAFARVFTGDKRVYIVPTGGASYASVDPSTGAQFIGMKVNVDLADNYRHDPQKCDKRDAFGQLKCAACIVRENILVPLFHEIGHLAYDSFEAIADVDKRRAIDEAVAEAERWGVKEKRLEKVRQNFMENPPSTYVEAAARISPFLHPILNSLEDARVNALTMRARRGMKVMFEARSQRIFRAGIEQPDGSVVMWREQPENAQVIIGLFCLASGYDYESWFVEDVENALADGKLRELVMATTRSGSAGSVYKLGFPILERLRELGFCQTVEDEPESEPEPGEGEPGDEGEDEGDPGEPGDGDAGDEDEDEGDAGGSAGEPGDPGDGDEDDDDAGAGAGDGDGDEDDAGAGDEPDNEDEPGDEDGSAGAGAGEDEPGDEDEGGGSSGGGSPLDGDVEDRGTPEEVATVLAAFGGHDHDEDGHDYEDEREKQDVEKAINQSEHFDQPSSNITGVHITQPFDGLGMMDPGELERKTRGMYATGPLDERDIQKCLGPMRLAFSENKKGSRERGLKSGRINARALTRVPLGDERAFQKRKRPGRRDYHVLIGIDLSGSTAGGAIKTLKSSALAQAELLSRLGVSFEVWGHTGTTEGSGWARESTVVMVPVKRAGERWNDETRRRLHGLVPVHQNLDGHTFEFYRKRLDESRATDRILMYYTDGAMPAENGQEELMILKREIRLCGQRGYEVVGIGVRTDAPKQHGLDTVRVDSARDVHRVVEELKNRLT